MRSVIFRAVLMCVLTASAWMSWGCVGEGGEEVTAPCEAGCSETATVGTACATAEECAVGHVCNLTFPGGYCQASCDGKGVGESCGEEEVGLCVGSSGAVGCLARCDPGDVDSCGRAEAACYGQGSAGVGVCHVRCAQDGDCGSGLACDGVGICRTVDGACNGLTDAGCGSGQRCTISEGGVFFCGEAGSARQGEGCRRSADCAEDLLCVGGACAARCDGEATYSCGELGGCVLVEARTGLGYCPR